MWNTDSLWFEIALVSIIYSVGNMTLGHFEEQTPKLRRVAKYLLTILIVCLIKYFLGRKIALIILCILIFPVLYIHFYYLPKKKGINGLTGEPKSKYYEFRGWDKNIFDRK